MSLHELFEGVRDAGGVGARPIVLDAPTPARGRVAACCAHSPLLRPGSVSPLGTSARGATHRRLSTRVSISCLRATAAYRWAMIWVCSTSPSRQILGQALGVAGQGDPVDVSPTEVHQVDVVGFHGVLRHSGGIYRSWTDRR